MTWVAVDDHLYSGAAFIGLSGDAAKLYVASYTWAGDHLTDGIVTDATVGVLARMYRLKNPEALVAELLGCGLWTGAPDGHAIADYLRLNPTRTQVEVARKKTREKVANWRERQRGSNPVTPEVSQLEGASVWPGGQRRNSVTSEGTPVENRRGNPVTPEPVTRLVTEPPTPTPNILSVSRRTRKGAEENGFATEDEIRDAEAFALAEELAE